jgi:hypothetical protein
LLIGVQTDVHSLEENLLFWLDVRRVHETPVSRPFPLNGIPTVNSPQTCQKESDFVQ